jgi:predicted dehydrogenase
MTPSQPHEARPLAAASRRQFLASHAAAAATLPLWGAALVRSPADRKVRIAGVGVGGQGGSDLQSLASEEVVALCDVDWVYAENTLKRFPGARRYHDFREMLDREKDQIDAVVVGTPDHTHAVITLAALKAGKHVYCEKPLTRTVREARQVAEAAARAGVATQMGNQGMAFEGNRILKEWLADGVIGPVHEAHVWSDRPTSKGTKKLWWTQGIERPTDTPPVPENLHWDLWLGPAPTRPYHPAYAHFRWRGWWDFGSGGLGDMGIHNLAPVFDALRLGPPTRIQGSSTPVFEDSVPAACVVHYDFDGRDGMPPLKLHWYDGGMMPPRPEELEPGEELDREDGAILVGEKGKLLLEGWGGRVVRLLPDSRMQSYQRPLKRLPRSIGHHEEFVRACKQGTPTQSHFGFAGPLTEAVLLGMVCIRNGGHLLTWDAAQLKVTNRPEANQFLHYDYRPTWSA